MRREGKNKAKKMRRDKLELEMEMRSKRRTEEEEEVQGQGRAGRIRACLAGLERESLDCSRKWRKSSSERQSALTGIRVEAMA